MPEGVRQHVPLSQYTTLHIGGVADYLWEVGSVEELKAACRFASQTDMPLLVLGGGSNVLIGDEGFGGLVVINKIKKRVVRLDGDSVVLKLGAGEVLDDVVAWTAKEGWWGIENLSSIPGTIGATPVQNVGAYGVEVSSVITQVRAIHHTTHEEKNFTNSECCFAYRDSFFKTAAGKEWIITEVTIELSRTARPQVEYADLAALQSEQTELTPDTVRTEIIAVRSRKFPDWTVVGTAGSFFKNPLISVEQYAVLKEIYPDIPGFIQTSGDVKVSLGYILDKVCGLRGYAEGAVGLYEKQALVLVAHEGATAADIEVFVKNISLIVFEKTKIKIECEVLFVKK